MALYRVGLMWLFTTMLLSEIKRYYQISYDTIGYE